MIIELDVKFNIGDNVRVIHPHNNGYASTRVDSFEAQVIGYVIHKNKRSTRVYYIVEQTAEQYKKADAYFATHGSAHKKRYSASELEKI